MYRSEAKFSAAFCTMLRKHCSFVQRIESGETGRGIPDIYCRFANHELWIELKNDRKQSIYSPPYLVPWRPGQRGWHHDYYKVCGRPVLTIMAMSDGYIVIPLLRMIKNPVFSNECYLVTELRDLWSVIKGEVGQ
jgi:hypothetical protein